MANRHAAMLTLMGTMYALAAAPAASVNLNVVPSVQVSNVGQNISSDVLISGLGAGTAPSVGTYDLDISFNPALLEFEGVTFGTGLDVLRLGSLQAATPGFGTVNIFELSFDSGTELNALQPSEFTLASLSFILLAAGTSSIGITVNALGDANGDSIALDQIGGGQVIAQSAGQIPEPGVLALLGIGLLGAMVAARAGEKEAVRSAMTVERCAA